jgi:hypothetical protein
VSEGGGEIPVWSRTGDRIIYLKDDALVMEVDVATGPEVRVSRAREVFSANPARLGPNHGFDITEDGRRFLMVHYGDPKQGSGDLILVTDWK